MKYARAVNSPGSAWRAPRATQLVEQHPREQRVAGDVELDEVFAGVAARGAEDVEPGGDDEVGEVKRARATRTGASGRSRGRRRARCAARRGPLTRTIIRAAGPTALLIAAIVSAERHLAQACDGLTPRWSRHARRHSDRARYRRLALGLALDLLGLLLQLRELAAEPAAGLRLLRRLGRRVPPAAAGRRLRRRLRLPPRVGGSASTITTPAFSASSFSLMCSRIRLLSMMPIAVLVRMYRFNPLGPLYRNSGNSSASSTA